MSRGEPLLRRWARRSISISLVFVGLTLWGGLLAPVLPFVLLLDLIRGRGLVLSRFLLAVLWVLVCEAVGVVASGLFWCRRLFGWSDEAWLDAHFRFQAGWISALLFAAVRLFGMRLSVEGAELASAGPVLMLVRHASVFDTLLPAALVSARYGLRLRYVLKRELLWDPCLDIVGQRLPNAFIRRRSKDPGRELAAVASLGVGLGPRDGALIYPEGTRFSPRRQAQIRATPGPQAEASARLLSVLPPKAGGVMALLDAAPDADVVICAHRGFDRVRRISDMWTGALMGQEIAVRFWRIPRSKVPMEAEARAAWLLDQWVEVDRFVRGQTKEG